MKTYKYIYLLCLLALQSARLLVAQNTMQQPTDLGNKAFAFIYTDTKNTANYTNDFQGQSSNDVFYKFTLTRAMDISIDHCGSGVYDTYLRVLNASGQVIYSNDDDWEYQYCENYMNSYLFISNLPAGTYYVVSEGYSQNGNITTTIQGISPYSEIGSSMATPIELGSRSYSFQFTDTKNTANYINNYAGQSSNDVFYKFTLTHEMNISIDHCGSGVYDTYLHVINDDGDEIYSNDDDDYEYSYCANYLNSYLYMPNLPAGTYYVVSEGYSANGNITTTIQGTRLIPTATTYNSNALTSTTNEGTNYILSTTPRIAVSDVSGLGINESLQTVQYFDGLGRPIQTVQRGITPTKQDLASYTKYDEAGREWKQYLPIVTSANGMFTPESNFTSGSSLYSAEGRPYNEAIIEPSPLNRVLGNKGPGAAWENKPTSITYETNTTGDAVAYFYVNATNKLERGTNYADGSLYKTVSKDEDNKSVTEYKDKLGQVIMKQSNTNVQTYFVYNDLGQLSYVIPPNAADGLTTSGVIEDDSNLLKQFCYLYKYDERGNCIYKRLPGCTPIYMIYDKADRLVLNQDGNQRKSLSGSGRQWTATKYDEFGRILYTGIMYLSETDSTTNYKSIRDIFVNELVVGNYTANNFNNCTPLSINYYDNYSFISSLPTHKQFIGYQVKAGFDKAFPIDATNHTGLNAKGLLTGTCTYYLDESGYYSATAMYYDYRGRVVQTRASNHLGGFDISNNQYNFSGQVTKSLKEHNIAYNNPITELYTNAYDHAGRLLQTKYKINTAVDTVLLVNNTYDDLGRLIQKKRHNDTDTEEYDYNIRNWTTRLKSGAFEEKLFYNNSSKPLYNGNISSQTWTYNGVEKGYNFEYDDLNRLLNATFKQGTSTQGNGFFDEKFTYDKMGNIKTLMRKKDNQLIDDLKMTYLNNNQSNQLQSIYDEAGTRGIYDVKEYQNKINSTTEMAYDVNGNLTKDLDRDIVAIKYNLLNLPEIIQFKNGNQIRNLYDASGQKLRTQNITIEYYITQPIIAENQIYDLEDMAQDNEEIYLNGTEYIGNVEYSHFESYYMGEHFDHYGIDFMQLYNSEGYCDNSFKYNYYRRDHLGNNREVWRAPYKVGNTNYPAATIQRTQYYPSGLPWASNSIDHPEVQNKKFNGCEFIEMHGLDVTDLGNRGVQNATNRFTSMDRFCEKFPWQSPYVHAGNNPVNYVDVMGDSIAVLLYPGTVGHMAMLIQNKEGKWSYYSVNGDDLYNSTVGVSGGKNFDEVGVGSWDSPADFLKDDFNQLSDKENDKEKANYKFSDAYILPTTKEQDNTMDNVFEQITKETYDVFTNNCADAVQRTLSSVGFDVNEKIKVDGNYTFVNGNLRRETKIKESAPIRPNTAFSVIKQNNPQGTHIRLR